MKIDSKLAGLLSDFFLDVAKAFFVATFVTPAFRFGEDPFDAILIIIKGLVGVIAFLYISWSFAKIEKK